MSDQTEPAVDPEAQSATEATEQQPEAPSTPWSGEEYQPERAYQTIQHLRGFEKQAREFDRLQNDPQALEQFLTGLGYAVEDPSEQQDEFADPTEQLAARLEQLEQSLSARDERDNSEQRAVQVRQLVDRQLEQLGVTDEEDGNDILAYAIHALPPTEDGLPDVKGAFDRFQTRQQAHQKQWVQSKRAPHTLAGGGEGTKQPPRDTHEQRVAYAMQRLQDAEG